MPILVDYSQLVLASLFVSLGKFDTSDDAELEATMRGIVLSSLLKNRRKFKKTFGDLVICVDGKDSWRKEVFPYYKASRKVAREASDLDWGKLFGMIHKVKAELKETFPYRVIEVDRAEADDIIGVIANEYGTPLWDGESEKILILSGDKDYIQLQKHANVEQYDPVAKKDFIRSSDPHKYLLEQTIRGDKGDGIPNILSPDNCFMIRERQGTITAERLARFSTDNPEMDEITKARFQRNKTLIDLSYTPDYLRESILAEYAKGPQKRNHGILFDYFAEKDLTDFIQDIQDF